jgi:hypothetical protein
VLTGVLWSFGGNGAVLRWSSRTLPTSPGSPSFPDISLTPANAGKIECCVIKRYSVKMDVNQGVETMAIMSLYDMRMECSLKPRSCR